jgi:hypothetical protein
VLMADLTVRRCYVIVASISTNQWLVQAVPVINGCYPHLESFCAPLSKKFPTSRDVGLFDSVALRLSKCAARGAINEP